MAHFVELRRVIARAATAAFTKHKVGAAQVSVMRELGRVGSASQACLARTLAQDPAALGRGLDALESLGWVHREVSTTDRRQKEASLTPEGKRALRRLNRAYDTLTERIDNALTERERECFVALSEKIITALNGEESEA